MHCDCELIMYPWTEENAFIRLSGIALLLLHTAATKACMDWLDAFHRRQLRSLNGH